MRRHQTTLTRTDGILLVPVDERGIWHAVRELRRGLARAAGGRPAAAGFFSALTGEGQLATRARDAKVLVLGYRID